MFEFLKKKNKDKINAPTSGKLISLSAINDDVFSKGMMGTGFAIKPNINRICAPVDGKVSVAFPTGHAYGITSKYELDILIHIGIDTVELEGKGFKMCVKQGDIVKKGDTLVEVDLAYLNKQGKISDCIFLFPNNEKITLLKENKEIELGESDFIEVS